MLKQNVNYMAAPKWKMCVCVESIFSNFSIWPAHLVWPRRPYASCETCDWFAGFKMAKARACAMRTPHRGLFYIHGQRRLIASCTICLHHTTTTPSELNQRELLLWHWWGDLILIANYTYICWRLCVWRWWRRCVLLIFWGMIFWNIRKEEDEENYYGNETGSYQEQH